MDEEFRAIVSSESGETALLVEGEVDAATAPALDAAFRALDAPRPGAAHPAPSVVVVDLSGVTFLDSSGLSVLIATHKRLRFDGRSLAVTGARPSVRRLFAISGLDRVLTIRE